MSKQFNHVYSFELDPDTFACFEKNVEYWKISNVTIKNCGLSNTHQFVGIADGRTKRSGGRHIKGSGSIPTTTIDALQLSNLDFLKLDLEGHEAKALEGARETLTAFHPIVIIEHKPHLARRYGGPNDAIDILHELGASLLDKVGKDNIDWVFGW